MTLWWKCFGRERPCVEQTGWWGRVPITVHVLIIIILLGLTAGQSFPITLSTGPIPEYLFVEGKKHYDAGSLQSAAEVWSNIFPDTLYGPVAYILLSRGYHKAGNLEKAEEALKELLRKHPGAVYRAAAKEELVRLLCEQKKPEAVPVLAEMIQQAPEKDKPELLLRLAQLERHLGNHAKAAEHYRNLFLNYPATVEGLKASDDLAWMVVHGKIERPAYSETEQMTRAGRLFNSGRFDLAAEAYQTLLRNKAGDTAIMLKLARCRYRDRWNQSAITMLKDALKGPLPEHDRMEALHLLSLAYWRLDRDKDFEFCCSKIIEKGPPGLKRKVLFNLGAYNYEKKKYAEAQTYFQRLLKADPDASMKADVKWRMAWIKYSTGQYGDAAQAFREARSASPGGRLDHPAKYWQARSLLHLKQPAEAQLLLKELVRASPLGYYGMEAARLLKEMKAPVEAGPGERRTFPDVNLTTEQYSNKAVSDANRLLDKGLHEFALMNLEALPRQLKSSPAIAFLTAKAAYGAHRYRLAQDVLTPVFGSMMENPPEDAPPEFIEMAYPRVHFTETTQHAKAHSVDPHLIWAVIRQESRYDGSAVSPAGALGLMQVTPEAAGLGGKKGKIQPSAIAEILDPQKNIALGIRILAKNLGAFGGKVVPAVASYNADIKKVRDWQHKRGKMQMDEFIENIPYLETRIYVKKVLAGYYAYATLHKKKDLAGVW